MAKKRGKTVSFDAMVKFFIKHYDIPRKSDIDNLAMKLDRLEKLILAQQASGEGGRNPGRRAQKKGASRRSPMTDADKALEIVGRFKKGVSFADVRKRTGFEDKKLRNIIYRLDKTGKITRKSRGVYVIT